MNSYQIWDVIFKGLTSLGVVAALITACIGVSKYRYEKNRDVYVKRLNEVYAPLYELLIKQETFRKMYFPDRSIIAEPIITLTHTRLNWERFSPY
ncbi:hypothetical protein [Paenibacillus planticolens]|uniref:Uncharacterized protein n=1 Tax=Paenibacillus planticolens TaxID=2654976 RepID=A0ABX1ZRM1_9BACL|nr:hypothetical protein [Paenibacillus planticolens]NOV02323.1 hypothetical protein [Paenibacillus planticolens]